MKLSELKNGESAIIVRVSGHGGFRKRIMEMGFVRGHKVTSVINAPTNDPIKYLIMGYDVSLRRAEADLIEVLSEDAADALVSGEDASAPTYFSCDDCGCCGSCKNDFHKTTQRNIINIAFVGNPNSGKTSLFNALSGGNEHVGNYSGVTVDVKTGHFNYKGYHFNVTDLPGTYSLSAYSPEEVYVRRHLQQTMPDIIVNAVVASNLERNLYLTTELIDLSQRVVVALNMYDELSASGAKLDYKKLGSMLGIPMVPTVAKNGQGLNALLDTIISVFEGKEIDRDQQTRHIHINYGTVMEPEISALSKDLHEVVDLPQQFPARYWALKMIEGDTEAVSVLQSCKNYQEWEHTAEKSRQQIEKELDNDIETAISDAKYGFISGALQETFEEGKIDINKITRKIDRLVANKWLGFPLFIFIMWLMFFVTFQLGSYPQDWIEMGFTALADMLNSIMPNSALRSLVVDGILAGVGAVCSFVPNILLLYLFISLMEDSGYMSRAAFIMDSLMHKMGLHGKSFVPMLMGFGCNAPAVMATRTIESRSSRLITMLIVPFMSCSARLPIYVLFAGTFFPGHAATVMILLYLLGILVAAFTAKMLRAVKFGEDETPFVMELPPYRMPTVLAVLKHMWDKCLQYIKKIGTVILAATVVVWVLTYFPRPMVEQVTETGEVVLVEAAPDEKNCEDSYLGKFGKLIEPIMAPLGFDWRASVAVVASIPAKEIAVSTLGVLYGNEDEDTLGENIIRAGTFSKASAMAMMVFMLLTFPCMATIAAVYGESGKKRWATFTVIYNSLIAWLIALVVYNIGNLIV
ncbi:MAG: ferrous iron transport protein B [Bacteroidales bacterium]|nr:ferrous iron transport protein B [Bacteroidales bacterium]